VYVAPPDVHLTVDGNGRLAVRHDAPVNHCRPSADVLFGSMADAYGSGSIAVVLTGMGRDGARGATAIRRRGGYVIAQDEASSVAFSMPAAAIDFGPADIVLPLDRISDALSILANASQGSALVA
jgi:two-component system chemotaxis response regulator CheB